MWSALTNVGHEAGKDGAAVEVTRTVHGNRGDRQALPVDLCYRLGRQLGKGTFGVVNQATMISVNGEPHNDVVAIKQAYIKKDVKEREKQTMVRLGSHANVVRLLYFFSLQDNKGPKDKQRTQCLVEQYMPSSLADVMKDDVLPMDKVNLYGYQIFRGLAHCHRMGICHRDVKPDNILVDPHTGALKLADLGSAKRLCAGGDNVAYICSRHYRAPELVLGAEDYGFSIDVWSAAVVMAEMALGRILFKGADPVDQLWRIVDALGTPNRLDMKKMKAKNQGLLASRRLVVKPKPWTEVLFGNKPAPRPTNKDLLFIVPSVLVYDPDARPSALALCAHSVFEGVRASATQRPIPLTDFSPEELAGQPPSVVDVLRKHRHVPLSVSRMPPSPVQKKSVRASSPAPKNVVAKPPAKAGKGKARESEMTQQSDQPKGVPAKAPPTLPTQQETPAGRPVPLQPAAVSTRSARVPLADAHTKKRNLRDRIASFFFSRKQRNLNE